ncbi:MAG: zinc ribbon domain-containing protein [Burkholderiaceae bacterium]
MPGYHGFGHIGGGFGRGMGHLGRGWGHGFGGGWGLGWIFPAWIVGQVISQAFDQTAEAPPSNWPPVPAPPFPAETAQAPAVQPTKVTCQGCGTQVTGTLPFCPVCGDRLSPAACRYCGQKLQTEGGLCLHCGAPRR